VTRQLRLPRPIHLLSLFAIAACAWPRAVRAQEANPAPIRVESHDVYVPVLVLDKARVHQLQKMDFLEYGKRLVANTLDFGAVAVRDLRAGDFRIFEDGRQQRIQSVTPDFKLARPIQDSVGLAEDFVGAGGGIWIAPGVAVDLDGNTRLNVPDWPGYLIAYVPPTAPDGRCHHVTVQVDRPHLLVFGRTEYCNTADPLKGTDLGEQIQSDLISGKKASIGLSLAAVDFFTSTAAARVHISVEYSPNLIWRTGQDCGALPEVRILGLIYSKDGVLVTRFSDFMSRNFSPRGQAMPLLLPTSEGPVSCSSAGPSYETQVNLAPGEYVLRVAIRDGKDFGHAELHFAVESHGGDHLAVSGIALGRRYRDATSETDQMPTALPVNYAPLLSRGFELTPKADATFQRSERLYYYFEMFEPLSSQLPTLTEQAHLRIIDAETGTVKIDLPPFSAALYGRAGNPVIPIGGAIDISELPRGLYRLEVQATDSAGQSTPWSAKQFTAQ